jgi:hypothetical protein
VSCGGYVSDVRGEQRNKRSNQNRTNLHLKCYDGWIRRNSWANYLRYIKLLSRTFTYSILALVINKEFKGLVLDASKQNYQDMFAMAALFYALALCLFSLMKFLANKTIIKSDGYEEINVSYTQFKDDYTQ